MANVAMILHLRSSRKVVPGRLLGTSFEFIISTTFFVLLTLAFGEGVLVLVAGDGSAPWKGMS